MIIDKHKYKAPPQEEVQPIAQDIDGDEVIVETEYYSANALCEVFNAVKKILGDLKLREDDPNSPPLFRTIKLNNGQLERIKNNKWNKEYAIAFPAVFLHFINVRYLVQQYHIGEGRATMRIQFVLNRLNNSDSAYELEGYEIFQRINVAIQDRKKDFPALTQRFQLEYFDQLESFDDGIQPFWIDYEVWFSDYSAYKYRNYVDRYIVMPPFTNHSDQKEGINSKNHPDHKSPDIESAAGFVEQ